jgi:hypothetical protein
LTLAKLIQATHKELLETDPGAFVVILLGLCVGLCKGEIDLLPWSAVKFDSSVIRIEPPNFSTSRPSTRWETSPSIPRFWKSCADSAPAPSRRLPQVQGTYIYDRCEPVFDRVLLWLKAHGVRQRNALHAVRKEHGSLINEKYDLVVRHRGGVRGSCRKKQATFGGRLRSTSRLSKSDCVCPFV